MRIVLLACLLICVGAPSVPADINERYEDSKLKIRFPKKLGDYTRGKLSRYDDNLGYSIPYNYEHSSVTIYVYTGGYASIERGVEDPNTIETFKAAKKDITTLEAAGLYKDMTVLRTGVMELSKTSTQPFLVLDLSITLPGRNGNEDLKARSTLLVTAFRNHFVKIRATQPETADKEALEEMLSAFAAFFKVHI